MWIVAALLCLAPFFEDATEEAGLGGVKGDRFTFADVDDDGDPDLVVQGRRLFLNRGGRFDEAKGALEGARGASAVCVDLDGDGLKDLFTSGGDLFLRTKQGGYRRLEVEVPERQACFGAGDVDGDGLPDLFTGGGELWKDNRSHLFPRRFLRNLGRGRFRDETETLGLQADRYGRSVVFADYDDDGDSDVYVGNYRLVANELWRNEQGRLEEIALQAGCRGVPRSWKDSGDCFGHTIAASWADLDNDGWLDLWVSNLVHKYVGPFPGLGFPDDHDFRGEICDDSNLFRNSGPPDFRFEDRRGSSGIALKPTGGRGVYRGDELWSNAACADFDNDGDLDVFVTQVYDQPYSHSFLFGNEGGGRFAPVDPGFRVFNGYGAAWADVDGDGRMDLVTGGSCDDPKGERRVRLWRNRTTGGHWIGFRFKEPALGAVVRVITDDGVLTRAAEACMGSHTQANSDILHFGLGERRIREVRICWPGGLEQRAAGTPARDKVHRIARKPWRKPPRPELALRDGMLVCTPPVRGARYHWDFDDDFATDAVTKEPEIAFERREGARSACVRVFRGDVAVRARVSLAGESE